MNTKNVLFLALSLLLGCSSNKVVVERKKASAITLPKEASIEIQELQGANSETFRLSLNQFLTERTSLRVIHSQDRNELIDSMIRGRRNQQTYIQADFIIRGSVQETVERRTSQGGTIQFAAISRPFLQLIETRTGRIIFSKYLVGTSLSSSYLASSNTNYDGYTDALINARSMALDKFISQFHPQVSWLEIELLPLKDDSKFKEIRNLLNHGRYEIAKTVLDDYANSSQAKDRYEKGRILFSLSVVESLLGNFAEAKSLLQKAHQLFPDEKILNYLGKIDTMELESKRIATNREESL